MIYDDNETRNKNHIIRLPIDTNNAGEGLKKYFSPQVTDFNIGHLDVEELFLSSTSFTSSSLSTPSKHKTIRELLSKIKNR